MVKMKKGKGQWCAALHCRNNRCDNRDLSFFHFPRNPERSRRWAINCKRTDLLTKDTEYLHRNCTLCRKHFEPHMFTSVRKNRLLDIAIPTLFLLPNTSRNVSKKPKPFIELSLKSIKDEIKSENNDSMRPLTPTFVSVSDADPFSDLKEDPDAINPFPDTDIDEEREFKAFELCNS